MTHPGDSQSEITMLTIPFWQKIRLLGQSLTATVVFYAMNTIDFREFQKLDLRVGTIVSAEPFPEARKAAYKLLVDFGEIGHLRSSVQITENYTLEELVGKQVIGVVNFPPKQIGPFVSECLVTGFANETGHVVLARPDRQVPNGSRLF